MEDYEQKINYGWPSSGEIDLAKFNEFWIFICIQVKFAKKSSCRNFCLF